MEHWLEREIAQWVHPMKDRSDDPSHMSERSTSELHPAPLYYEERYYRKYVCGCRHYLPTRTFFFSFFKTVIFLYLVLDDSMS